MDLNFLFQKQISMDVSPVVTVTMVNALEVNKRFGSVVIQLIDAQGQEVERKEINYSAGESFEKFYNDYVSTSALSTEIVDKTSLPIPTDIVDPTF